MEIVSIRKLSARPSGPALPVPAGSVVRALAGLDDRELLRIARSRSRSGQRRAAACELLVSRHANLVRSCVRRYRHTPEPAEELMQVGYVGLVKAINNFDPAKGGSLAAYARACVVGEIKRHFRDKRWHVHVERSVRELVVALREATVQLPQQLGYQPSHADLARYLGVSDDDLADARRAELAFQPCSLDAPLTEGPGAASLADVIGGEDPKLEQTLDLHALATHWPELPHRDQQILLMRFYEDMSQAEIGQRLGISQMHVSRLLSRALAYLRRRMIEPEDDGTGLAASA